MGSLMPGSFPSDDVPLSTVMGPVGGNTPINAYESLQLVNNRRFTNKHWVNERIRNQKQLILCLDTLVYVIVGYQFIKFSYSAALFPVVMHIVAQRLISVDTYLQNSHGGNLRTGVIGVILMIANTEGVAGSRRNSRRSSRRGSPEPERRRERERGGGMRVINVNLPRAGSNRSPEPTENTASSSTAPTTNNSVMVTEDAKRAYLNLLVKRICAFIYWKFIIVSIYHIIFISFWLMPFAMSDEIQKFQFGVWWFISFIGETPPTNVFAEASFFKRTVLLGLPGLILTNLIILFLQLVLFQCIYYQSTVSPLGRKLVEDDDNLLRLPGDNSYKNDDECIQNQNDSILLVKLFGLFQWESFTFI